MFPLYGYLTSQDGFCATAKPLALLQGLALAVSFGVLMYGFLVNDFSVKYVADNSNRLALAFSYECGMGCARGFTSLVVINPRILGCGGCFIQSGIPDHMSALVLSVMGMISVDFSLYAVHE